MTRTKKIDIRVKREEFEQITRDSNLKGYDSLSSYLRALALGRDFAMGKTIIETNLLVKKLMERED